MDNVKISLSLLLPGSKRYTQEYCESNPNCFKTEIVTVHYLDKKSKKVHRKDYAIKMCGTIPAKQTANLSIDAYNGFLEDPINGFKKKEWMKLSKDTRIKMHCVLFAENLGGKLIDYKVFSE